jgi:hypothetical protein
MADSEGGGQEVQAQPKANVRLAQGAKPVTIGGDVNVGGHGTIKLPSEEQQRAGFYLEDEALTLLLTQYPSIYKPIQPKGRAAVPVPPKTTQGAGINAGQTGTGDAGAGNQGQPQGEEAQS